jgi:hypothetical protein
MHYSGLSKVISIGRCLVAAESPSPPTQPHTSPLPGSDRVRPHHGTVRTNWWTERAGEVDVLRLSTPRQTRWSPHSRWPVLRFLLLLFPSWKGFWGWGWGSPCWLVLPRPTRWSPHFRWPVLPVLAAPRRPADALRSRPLSDKRRRSPDAPRFLARSALPLTTRA